MKEHVCTPYHKRERSSWMVSEGATGDLKREDMIIRYSLHAKLQCYQSCDGSEPLQSGCMDSSGRWLNNQPLVNRSPLAHPVIVRFWGWVFFLAVVGKQETDLRVLFRACHGKRQQMEVYRETMLHPGWGYNEILCIWHAWLKQIQSSEGMRKVRAPVFVWKGPLNDPVFDSAWSQHSW